MHLPLFARTAIASLHSPSLTARSGPFGATYCTDENFAGTCGSSVQPGEQCNIMYPPMAGAISSFAPNSGSACILYQNSDCSSGGQTVEIVIPGTGILDLYGWNDVIGSFKCFSANSTVTEPIVIPCDVGHC